MDKLSMKPCPICHKMSFIVGQTKNGKKLASCGHAFHFKKTKSQKDMDKKYIKTAYGLERVKT